MKWRNFVQPTNILALFFFLVPWQTRYILSVAEIGGTPIEFATLSLYGSQLLLAGGLIAAYAVHGFPRIDRRYHLALALGGAIILMASISGVMASDIRVVVAGVFELVLAALCFVALLDARVQVKNVMFGFVLGLIVPSIFGLAQLITGSQFASSWLGLAARQAERPGDAVTIIDGVRVLRAYGTFSHPNIFGGYLAVALAGLFALWPWAKTWPSSGRTAFFAAILLLAVTLAGTFSRSAVLGLLLGSGLAWFVLRWRNTTQARLLVIPLAGLVIGGAIAASIWAPNVIAGVRGGGVTEIRSLTERRTQYSEWVKVMEHGGWLFGHGPRNYVPTLAAVDPGRPVWEYQPVHNVPLLIVSELGLLGALIVFVWSSTIDRLNFARFPNRDAVAAFAMGNVVLVILFFDHYIWSSWSGLALIALVMALTLRLGEDSDITLGAKEGK